MDRHDFFLDDASSPYTVDTPVDLTNCDKEPIHIPGLIQPHGVLLALDAQHLNILQVSDNVRSWFGCTPEQLLGQPLTAILGINQVEHIRHCLLEPDLTRINPLSITVQVERERKKFEGIVHRIADGPLILFEMEPVEIYDIASQPDFYQIMHSSAGVLQGATDLSQLCQVAAQTVRSWTGFDRVMIYRFHPDWHGEVIAEAKDEALEPYLGLHYPASDIPQQARELYRHNWLRLIADVSYRPASIIPTDNPQSQQPLDLSSSVLRSVSPMHIQYLKNMGVGASMSVSIIKHNELWGLISCHHTTARYVPYTVRSACEFLGQMLSLQIAAQEQVDEYARRMRVKDQQSQLQLACVHSEDILSTLQQRERQLLEVVDAQGVILSIDGNYRAIGQAPEQVEGMQIVQWLQLNMQDILFVSASFASDWPQAEKWKDQASGILAVKIAPEGDDYIVWLRPEVVHEMQWGGDPQKPVQMEHGSALLSPRTSFEIWSQTVRLQSAPWHSYELEAVQVIRSAVLDGILRGLLAKRTQELLQLNKKLEESNNELDSFTYIVSHDLKEPLRGINNYVQIIQEDYGKVLNAEGQMRLHTLSRLTDRLDNFIDSLLHYSRMGSVAFSRGEVDLNEVLEHSLDLLKGRIEELDVQIRIPRPLPVVLCDRVRVGEIFINLITNAMKYNDKSEKWIEIGYLEPGSCEDISVLTFYVRDNGIGMREKYYDTIFHIFKRLHGRDKFGGGTGAGLTIVKKIVERHQGSIWVQSHYGEGTTFYFTLQGR